jgi:hypothetical protein
MGPTGTSPSSAAGDLLPGPARPDSPPRDAAAIPRGRAGRSGVALIPAVGISIVVLAVFLLGSVRILQLRRLARRTPRR